MQSKKLAFTELNKDELSFIISLIYKLAGIHLDSSKKVMIETRLSTRARALKFKSLHKYIFYLKSTHGVNEYQGFINALTTNKTHFFREELHYEYLRKSIIKLIEKKKEIYIWCAAGSKGHEAYTCAFICEELKSKYSFSYKILSTDIDVEVTLAAEKGIYSELEVKRLQKKINIASFFVRGEGSNQGLYKVKDSIKEHIKFRKYNLTKDKINSKIKFDFIFLRNVLIYFDNKNRVSVVEGLLSNLVAEGSLVLGYTEHLPKELDQFKYIGKSIYKRADRLELSTSQKTNKYSKNIILIGASTGGTVALKQILSQMPADFPPIVVAQHIPAHFSKALCESLNSEAKVKVKEAENGELIVANTVYISPGDKHIKVLEKGSHLYLEVNQDVKVNQHRPSVDYLFASAKKIKSKRIIAIILTGMGKDGAKELLELRKLKHITLGQDEATSTVYGMPREAARLKAVDRQLPLKSIVPYVIKILNGDVKK